MCEPIDLRLLLDRDHYIDYLLYRDGIYERSTLETISNLLNSGPRTFLDVGANIGLMSLYVARHHPSVRVEAFEPFPASIVQQRANMMLNDLTYRLNEFALSDAEGELVLYPQPSEPGLNLGKSNPGAVSLLSGGGSEEGVRVKAATLDGHVAASGIDLTSGCVIKIDVEGAELPVLEGMEALLASDAAMALIVEQNYAVLPEQCRAIDERLAQAGFTMHDFQAAGVDAPSLSGGRPDPVRNGTYLFRRGI